MRPGVDSIFAQAAAVARNVFGDDEIFIAPMAARELLFVRQDKRDRFEKGKAIERHVARRDCQDRAGRPRASGIRRGRSRLVPTRSASGSADKSWAGTAAGAKPSKIGRAS